jgi:hypothetical protein
MQVLKSIPGAVVLMPLALLALAGCQSDPDEKAPQCPVALTRPDAASVVRYDGGGRDLTNLVLSAKLEAVKGACKGQIGHKVITAHAHAEFLMTRGPAAKSPATEIQYVVSVLKNDNILEKKLYTQHVVFPPNVDTVKVTGDEIQFSFPTQRGLSGPSYKIYFVLQLSPDELAANQKALEGRQQ